MELKLTSSFEHDAWKLKYGLHRPRENGKSTTDQAKTVVFVHGTPWSSVVYQPMAQALLAKGACQVLLYDLPGYGESQERQAGDHVSTHDGKFLGDTSVKAQAGALTALLQHLKLDGKDGNAAPVVIAHDIAGAIVLRAHLIHGCEFRSLLLMDTNTVLPWGDGFYKLARSSPGVFLELPAGIFEAVVRAVTRSACFNPRVLEAGWEEKLVRPWLPVDSDAQSSFVRQIAQANDGDVAEMLDASMYEKVHCNVKIVWGEEDQWIPRTKMEQLAGMLKEKLREFVVVPQAGHLVMLDQPERVMVEVFEWISIY